MQISVIRKYSFPLTVASALLLLFSAPYLIPENPDSAVFRSGCLSVILILAGSHAVYSALRRHTLRQLAYGFAFALIFSFSLGLGGELHIYEKLLPGLGSALRRVAVPFMAAPMLGALASYFFALDFAPRRPRRQIPWPFFFILFFAAYFLVFLAFFPGIINYDFTSEYHQYMTHAYDAKHTVFHTWFSGAVCHLGSVLFGSQTAGAALYTLVQITLISAMYTAAFAYIQRRIPLAATVVLALLTAFLPFHGILAVSTVKDTLFTGLCVLLCLNLHSMIEDPDAFIGSFKRMAGFVLICLFMALLRHNGVFAFLPAVFALLFLCKKQLKRAGVLACVTLLVCFGVPRGLEYAFDATKSPSSELMSIPCQQLMRTAEHADVTEEEYLEINEWFSNVTYRYKPHYADTAKGNLDIERYNREPQAFWKMYFQFAARYPVIYLEAFLENSAGIWYPDDTSHAHTMDSEDWDYVYLKLGNILPEELSEVEAHSYLPRLKTMLFNIAHHSSHEQIPLLSLLMRPATYVYLLLLALMYSLYLKKPRFILCLLPVCGITLSLLFSACILVRYAYPIMTAAPLLLALIFFSRTGMPDSPLPEERRAVRGVD